MAVSDRSVARKTRGGQSIKTLLLCCVLLHSAVLDMSRHVWCWFNVSQAQANQTNRLCRLLSAVVSQLCPWNGPQTHTAAYVAARGWRADPFLQYHKDTPWIRVMRHIWQLRIKDGKYLFIQIFRHVTAGLVTYIVRCIVMLGGGHFTVSMCSRSDYSNPFNVCMDKCIDSLPIWIFQYNYF